MVNFKSGSLSTAFFKSVGGYIMKTTIYPYDIFNPWPGELLNWWDGFYKDEITGDYNENAFGYTIELDVHGMRKKDLKIAIQNDLLTVEGHRKKSSKKWLKDKGNFVMNFRKSFTIPESVDENKLKAKYSDGRLSITMPKKKEFIHFREIPVEGTNNTKMNDDKSRDKRLSKTGDRFKKLFKKAA